MYLYKTFLLAGAAALVSSAALAGGHSMPLRASAVVGSQKSKAPHTQVAAPVNLGAPKCGTGFGSPPPTPDGLIAWNDTSGTSFDTGGGADFTCAKKAKVKKVVVKGYFGTATEQFNVIFYQNDSADGSDEANDSAVKCSYTGLIGQAGGQYPQDVTTTLSLSKPCKLKKGHYWVEVQNNDSAGPWYWEVQGVPGGGTAPADWVDRHDVFGSGCTTLDNDRYLVDCLGYPYPDFMLELH